jgi:putative ABC transport system substrate-binding protein
VRTPEDFDEAFQAAAAGRAEAMLAFDDPMLLSSRARVVALAAKHRLPTMYGLREFPDAGGLLTKFDLVINLKTAKALGVTIPPSLLQRTDQVIE